MFWLNLFLFLILTAGHTELIVVLVNRLHAKRIRCGTLRQIRHIHDLMIPLFPLLIIWFVGLRGPELLRGGSWSELSIGWEIVFGICTFGFVGLCYSSVRSLLYRIPKTQLSNHSQTIDIAERLGFRPLGDGPFRLLTRIPGNEIFRVEMAEKTYQLPRLPREWDRLSILHLTDLHFIGTLDRPYFEQVLQLSAETKPDLIVFTGDLLDQQRLVSWLPATLGQLSAPLGCYFILGNHDWFLEPEEIRAALTELGWIDVAGKTAVVSESGKWKAESGISQEIPNSEFRIPNSSQSQSTRPDSEVKRPSLVIAGTECPWMGTHPDFSSTPENAFRLLLSHTPDNLPWAKSQGVDLMLSGHNHGGQVVLPIIGPVYSPSRYGVRYAGGAFWEEPTLLYVSRGISGRHPLRFGSPPELTKLVLRAEP